MRPRARMAGISVELTPEEMAAAARKFRHRRLPVYDGDLDTIVGVLNTRTFLLDPTGDLADAIEFPSFVPETMNLLQLLKSLQRQKRSMALVLDEFAHGGHRDDGGHPRAGGGPEPHGGGGERLRDGEARAGPLARGWHDAAG